MSRVGKSSATLQVSETFKEEREHVLKAELKPLSLLNALRSLRSGLFHLAFEVLLSFKLNSSWSVTNLLEKLRFSKGRVKPEHFRGNLGEQSCTSAVSICSVLKCLVVQACESHALASQTDKVKHRECATGIPLSILPILSCMSLGPGV